MSGSIIVLSGPSGAGKSTLIKTILEEFSNIYFSISTTTRNPREGEVEGVNYYYVSKEKFENDIGKGFFLEWANVHGNYYGTSLEPINKALVEGKIVLFDIDVQGQKIVKEKFNGKLVSIFITTPTQEELKKRLLQRGTDSSEVIEKRVENAKKEILSITEYDYLIVNDVLKDAIDELRCLVKSLFLKLNKDKENEILNNWG